MKIHNYNSDYAYQRSLKEPQKKTVTKEEVNDADSQIPNGGTGAVENAAAAEAQEEAPQKKKNRKKKAEAEQQDTGSAELTDQG